QSSDSVAQMFGEFLGCTAHPACQRNNRKAGADEQGGFVPELRPDPQHDGYRNKNQQPVNRGLKQRFHVDDSLGNRRTLQCRAQKSKIGVRFFRSIPSTSSIGYSAKPGGGWLPHLEQFV